MFSALLVPLFLTSGLQDAQGSLSNELDSQGIALVAKVTPTRFTALNPSHAPVLLLFGHAQSGARSSVVLPAGTWVEYRFPVEALEGLAIEVVSFVDGAAQPTGTLDLETLLQPSVEGLWVQSAQGASYAWAEVGDAWLPLRGAGHLFGRARQDDTLSAVHVPVITPNVNGIDTPPKIEQITLPPI